MNTSPFGRPSASPADGAGWVGCTAGAAGGQGGCQPVSDVRESSMPSAIANIRLFEGLPDSELTKISKVLVQKKFAAGETIFSPTESCDRVHFVRSGKIRLKRLSPLGKEQTTEMLKAGDACVCSPDRMNVECALYAEAATPCVVWAMPREQFAELVQSVPAVSLNLNRELASKLSTLGRLIEDLAFNSAQTRLIQKLLQAAKSDETGGCPTVFMSQDEIARQIGVTRETVARQLSTLRRSKLIATRPRRILLLDPSALKKLL